MMFKQTLKEEKTQHLPAFGLGLVCVWYGFGLRLKKIRLEGA
jgi:hypothetical protein